ncbi:hypothetical protein [Undibacterium flavidum]|uniref:Uncharacterized protein n=1 Tax=Undibacterium flavidum TaxID=2762297 RepID=A0ABR6YGX2_9BURK|nr:hypothetical protein [Undibacterium flavidum]MBC3875820.1 hypothetical protein [Undibacterium flavidum]
MKQALTLIKSISESELEFISKADYGDEYLRHKEALKKLIFEQNGIVNADQLWFPYEVVELSRWSCKEDHEREFAISNVIIALSILGGADTTNSTEYMFDQLSHAYERLPLELRNIVVDILFLAKVFQEKS